MKKHRKNNESDKDGIREYVYFCSRWSLALFAAFAVLTGWVFKTAKAGEYDIFFWVGLATGIVAFVGSIGMGLAAIHFIKKMRKPK